MIGAGCDLHTEVERKTRFLMARIVPGKTAGGIELVGKGGAEQDEATTLVNSYRRRLSMALN